MPKQYIPEKPKIEILEVLLSVSCVKMRQDGVSL